MPAGTLLLFCSGNYGFVYVQILPLSKFTQRTACISFSLALEANFSEIYAVKVQVWRASQ